MTAFLLTDVLPEDMEAYRASGYLEAAGRTAVSFGGVYKARGGAPELETRRPGKAWPSYRSQDTYVRDG